MISCFPAPTSEPNESSAGCWGFSRFENVSFVDPAGGFRISKSIWYQESVVHRQKWPAGGTTHRKAADRDGTGQGAGGSAASRTSASWILASGFASWI